MISIPIPIPFSIPVPIPIEKFIIVLRLTIALTHLTCFTPRRSKLYFANSLATVFSERPLDRLLTFHDEKQLMISNLEEPG
jgi:hypothetical protein